MISCVLKECDKQFSRTFNSPKKLNKSNQYGTDLDLLKDIRISFLKSGMLSNLIKIKIIFLKNYDCKYKIDYKFFFQVHWLRIFFSFDNIETYKYDKLEIDFIFFFLKYFQNLNFIKNMRVFFKNYLKYELISKNYDYLKKIYIIFFSEIILEKEIICFKIVKNFLIKSRIFYSKNFSVFIKNRLCNKNIFNFSEVNAIKIFLKTLNQNDFPIFITNFINNFELDKKIFLAKKSSLKMKNFLRSIYCTVLYKEFKNFISSIPLFNLLDYNCSYFKFFRNKKLKFVLNHTILNLKKKNIYIFLQILIRYSNISYLKNDVYYYYMLIKKKIERKSYNINILKKKFQKNLIIDFEYLSRIIEIFYQKNRLSILVKLIFNLFIYMVEFNRRKNNSKKHSLFLKNSLKILIEKILMNDIDNSKINFSFIFKFFKYFKPFNLIDYYKIDNILIYKFFNFGNFKVCYKLIRKLCLKFSNSIKYWFYLSEIQKKIGLSLSKTLKYSLRILKRNPNTLPGIIFTGNLCSDFGSRGYAVSEYFQAYRYEKNSSLLNFSIAIQYIFNCLNRKNFFSDYSFIIGYSFFSRYLNIRKYSSQYLKYKNSNFKIHKSEGYFNKSIFLNILGLKENSLFELQKSINIIGKSLKFTFLNRKNKLNKFILLYQKQKNILNKNV